MQKDGRRAVSKLDFRVAAGRTLTQPSHTNICKEVVKSEDRRAEMSPKISRSSQKVKKNVKLSFVSSGGEEEQK